MRQRALAIAAGDYTFRMGRGMLHHGVVNLSGKDLVAVTEAAPVASE